LSFATTGEGFSELWSTMDFELTSADDRHHAFIVPHGLPDAGDTFVIELSFSDGSTQTYSRMLNYVFYNVPRLVNFGAPGDMQAFAAQQPIEFDGAQNLVLEFNPPVDETGAYLTAMNYEFEIFYYAAADGSQVQNVDGDATFADAIAGFSTQSLEFVVTADELSLSGDDTYTVELPAEMFVDSVITSDGDTVEIGSYKIDIAAQRNANAAVMLQFRKAEESSAE
jgi:hypothetical protein